MITGAQKDDQELIASLRRADVIQGLGLPENLNVISISEEEIADASEKLFEQIDSLPPKFFEMKTEMDEGLVRLQAQPEMKVFLNGREEKRRV